MKLRRLKNLLNLVFVLVETESKMHVAQARSAMLEDERASLKQALENERVSHASAIQVRDETETL